MTRNRTVSVANPMNWIGFRPQRSMKTKDAQYPGTSPATDKTRFPRLKLCRFWYIVAAAGRPFFGEPKPIAPRIIDEFSPRP